ncbi:MAG: hypothetical protein ACTS53_01600 [Candidatus Hodgkinia cicadicola]
MKEMDRSEWNLTNGWKVLKRSLSWLRKQMTLRDETEVNIREGRNSLLSNFVSGDVNSTELPWLVKTKLRLSKVAILENCFDEVVWLSWVKLPPIVKIVSEM